MPTKIYFSPKGGCATAIVAELAKAKKTILIQAYSFTSMIILNELISAKKAGVDVRVILDKSWPTTAPKVKITLENAGVIVLIDEKHNIAHNKIIIIDSNIVITGSYNFSESAEYQNAENLLVIKDKKIAVLYLANWQNHASYSVLPVLGLPPLELIKSEFPKE